MRYWIVGVIALYMAGTSNAEPLPKAIRAKLTQPNFDHLLKNNPWQQPGALRVLYYAHQKPELFLAKLREKHPPLTMERKECIKWISLLNSDNPETWKNAVRVLQRRPVTLCMTFKEAIELAKTDRHKQRLYASTYNYAYDYDRIFEFLDQGHTISCSEAKQNNEIIYNFASGNLIEINGNRDYSNRINWDITNEIESKIYNVSFNSYVIHTIMNWISTLPHVDTLPQLNEYCQSSNKLSYSQYWRPTKIHCQVRQKEHEWNNNPNFSGNYRRRVELAKLCSSERSEMNWNRQYYRFEAFAYPRKYEGQNGYKILEFMIREPNQFLVYAQRHLKPVEYNADQYAKYYVDLHSKDHEIRTTARRYFEYHNPNLYTNTYLMYENSWNDYAKFEIADLIFQSTHNIDPEIVEYCTPIVRIEKDDFPGRNDDFRWMKFSFARKNDKQIPEKFADIVGRGQGFGFSGFAGMANYSFYNSWHREQAMLWCLGILGTPEAISILQTVAKGHPKAGPTKVAREILQDKGISVK